MCRYIKNQNNLHIKKHCCFISGLSFAQITLVNVDHKGFTHFIYILNTFISHKKRLIVNNEWKQLIYHMPQYSSLIPSSKMHSANIQYLRKIYCTIATDCTRSRRRLSVSVTTSSIKHL